MDITRFAIIVMVLAVGITGISVFIESVLHFSHANEATLFLIIGGILFIIVCPNQWLFGYEDNGGRAL